MPYSGIPKDKESKMESCVSDLMDSKDMKDKYSDAKERKSHAIAICHDSIMGNEKVAKVSDGFDSFRLYGQFEKIDPQQRIVYGYASTECVDSQGEVVSKTAIAQALPDYMQYGNIREMHQLSAVGKTKSAVIDDKGLYLKAKIVDDMAWQKVAEGVYNGFSIGGKVIQRVDHVIKQLELDEISIVDRPANPEAVFTVIKFHDGKPTKGGEQAMEKQVEGQQEMPNTNVFYASQLVELGKQIVMLMDAYEMTGRNTSALKKALEALKSAATQMLGEEQAKKIDGELDIYKASLVKVVSSPDAILTEAINKKKEELVVAKYFETLKKVL